MNKFAVFNFIFLSLMLLTAVQSFSNETVQPDEIGITEKIGTQLNLNLPVRDDDGRMVQMSEYFKFGKPVILTPIYFACAGLCNFQLNGLIQTLKSMDWVVGDQFHVVAFSFDPREAAHAALKKENYVKAYGRPETKNGWHFLTAEQASIDELTSSVGFKYKWNEKEKEWMHASAAIIISPSGKIIRYLHGIRFEPREIKYALIDASEGTLGSPLDKLLRFFYNFNKKGSL